MAIALVLALIGCSHTEKVRLPSNGSTIAPEGCIVSKLLVPTCGAWLGSSIPSNDGTFDPAVGLDEYEAVAQNTPDILHFYKTDGDVFPDPTEVALSERADHQRSLLFYNWKPSTTLTWRQIADGRANATLDAAAANIKAYPHRFFLALYHEPENDLAAAGSGMTPPDYVGDVPLRGRRARAAGVDNVVYRHELHGFRQVGRRGRPAVPG